MIRIQNIYYMLAYAFDILNEAGYRLMALEEFEYASDLFAAILAKGIGNQIKRGLYREYISKTEATSSPCGKINVSASVSQNTMLKRKLICNFDEYSENAYMNRIIKTTVRLLIRCPEVSEHNKTDLRRNLLYFSNVEEINPKNIKWTNIRYHRNNAAYKMLMNICYLVIEGMLMTEKDGTHKLAKYIDEQHMHKLFEKFVLKYYCKHYSHLNPSSPTIEWDLDDGDIAFLPTMKTDITLSHQGKTLIIDTKYYSRTMQVNSRFNSKTIHSNNLYQIYAYVKNMDSAITGNVSGLLLYAKTDEEIFPDSDYVIGGNRIGVKTLDLNCDFIEITKQLNGIVEKYL